MRFSVLGVMVFACSANSPMEREVLARERQSVSEAEAVAEAPAPAGGLSADMVAPYFSGPGAEKFAAGQYEAAHAEFSKLTSTATGDDRARLELLMAECDARRSQWGRAAAGFASVAEKLPLVADYANYQAARAYFFARERKKSMEFAKKVNPDSTAGSDAALLIGDMLRGQGNPRPAADHYKAYLDKRPRGIRWDEARFRLAEAYERLRRFEDAIQVYKSITVDIPFSSFSRPASDRIKQLVKRLPKNKRGVANLTAADRLARGLVYFDLQRSETSENDIAGALQMGGLTPEQTCTAAYHRAYNFWKLRNRERAAPLFDRAIELCDRSTNIDLQVKSRYQAGRSYARIGDWDTAIARHKELEEKFPTHNYADDARLRQAECYREKGDEAKEAELLSAIPTLYPTGDIRIEATWRLGWRAFKKGSYQEANSRLEKQIELKPIETDWWAEGQPQYWIGRAWAKLGNERKSIAAYENTVRTYPLSYYSMLALNRLRESHPKQFAKLVQEIQAPPPPNLMTFSFENRELLDDEGFRRGLEFLRLGLNERAETELLRAGFTAPPHRNEVKDPAHMERLWAMAYLFDAAGRYTQSHWVTRWHVLDYRRGWPEADNRLRWRIAYPKAYWELLDKYARKQGYPTELQIAFVREESAFDPNRESIANAHGLTQMIIPTARRFAKGTRVRPTRDDLRDPEKNVIIGSNFLGFLMKHYQGRIGLVVPAYNAGEGAVNRWLREFTVTENDAFAEEIPYDETRGYNKRVLGSFFAYSYLNDRTIPEMPNSLPKN
jgi:soluble lytic murein transglycosylase